MVIYEWCLASVTQTFCRIISEISAKTNMRSKNDQFTLHDRFNCNLMLKHEPTIIFFKLYSQGIENFWKEHYIHIFLYLKSAQWSGQGFVDIQVVGVAMENN